MGGEQSKNSVHNSHCYIRKVFLFFPLCIPRIPSGKSPLFTKPISEQRLPIKAIKIEKL